MSSIYISDLNQTWITPELELNQTWLSLHQTWIRPESDLNKINHKNQSKYLRKVCQHFLCWFRTELLFHKPPQFLTDSNLNCTCPCILPVNIKEHCQTFSCWLKSELPLPSQFILNKAKYLLLYSKLNYLSFMLK